MTRTEERKIAFEIIFMFPFNSDKSVNDILTLYAENNDLVKISDYICNTVNGVADNLDDIDLKIKNSIKNRKFERLNNVCLTTMRLAVYEMLYNDDIPVSVAVNEAIEIAKEYDESVAAFVHGNLSIIAKNDYE